jgi:hypothetical protein
MNYVLVNHVPFAFTRSAAEVRTAPAMLADLRAQAAALAEAGLRLLVAAPVLPANHPAAKRCTSESFSPDEIGFELLHLPVYQSMRDYLRRKEKLVAALTQHLAVADIAQLGYGGHPMMLGEVAWPIAHAAGAKIVWMFDGVDPFERMKQLNRRDNNPVRRLAKQRLLSHKIRFCREAVAKADWVIAHHPSIKDRFPEAWDSHCRLLDAPLFDADELPSEQQLEWMQAQRADKNRGLRFAVFEPQNATDPADHLIRALAHCRRLSVPMNMDIIAPAAAAQKLMKLTGEMAMGEFVRHVDPPTDTAGWVNALSACDAHVNVSLGGFDETRTYAALGCGLPMVAYENASTDRLIETASAGMVVPEQNVALLAQAMIDLHRERRLLNRYGENAWRVGQQRTLQANHRQRVEMIVSQLNRRVKVRT